MKTLVFSDTHLSEIFEEKKYQQLEKLIQGVGRVIINGDFWDGYLTNFDAFIHSKWNGLFPLLKKKETVYIYGNHDRKAFSDNRTSLFSIKQCERYEMEDNGRLYTFEHGNKLVPAIDDLFNISRKRMRMDTLVFSYLERFITHRIRGASRIWGILLNYQLKQVIKGRPGFFAFGHTHFAEFSLQKNFANGGFIQFGLAQYLLIEDGCITPKSEWYE